MLYLDGDSKFPADRTGDCGDSLVRASILKLCGRGSTFSILEYEIKPGWLVRHPKQEPWNNRFNLTRDQLMCAIAALVKYGHHDAVKRIFYARMKQCFFTQSWQRDYPGTWKKPWPHIMRGGDAKDEGKLRLFDFADPLWPNHISCLILGGRVYCAYWFLIIGYVFHFVFMAFHSVEKEQNQMLSECYCLKTISIFNKIKPRWILGSLNYWQSKDEIEYHLMLMECFLEVRQRLRPS